MEQFFFQIAINLFYLVWKFKLNDIRIIFLNFENCLINVIN